MNPTVVCAYRARKEDSRPPARPTIKQKNEHLCLGCAQLLNDRRAVMRLVYDKTLNGKMMTCPVCGGKHKRESVEP
jgi:hypothetical protein